MKVWSAGFRDRGQLQLEQSGNVFIKTKEGNIWSQIYRLFRIPKSNR